MVGDGYTVPSCWPSSELGDCLSVIRNGLSKKQNKIGIGLPVSRIETISGDVVDPDKVGYLSELSHDEIERYRLKVGDILFSHINSELQLGRTAIYQGTPDVLIHGMNLLLLRVNSHLDGAFLHLLCTYLRARGVFIALAGRAVGQSSINHGKLKTLEVPVPPLPEQRKIAAVLGLVQRAIEQQERLVALTTELKKTLLHRLFTEGLCGEPQKQTEIGPVPESWEVVTLDSLFDIKHGYAFEGKFFTAQGRYVLLTPGHFFEEGGFRDQKDKTKYYVGNIPRSYVLAKGNLLVAMTEQKAGLLGSAIIVPENEKYLHNQRLGLIQNLDMQRLDKLFLFYFFNTVTFRQQIFLTSSGSKVRHTSPGKIRQQSIALPALDEQTDIAQLLSGVDAKLDVTKRKHQSITDLFRTLLHQLMTAEIRVQDLDLDGILQQPVAETDDGFSPNRELIHEPEVGESLPASENGADTRPFSNRSKSE